MATKASPKLPNRKVAKELSSPKQETTRKQRYFRNDGFRVEQAKKNGWKVVTEKKDKHNRKLGVRNGSDDLVLMEK